MKLYTVKEAAKTIGVSTNTLYKYLDDGRIHAARGTALQGRFRIPESALEEFLGVKLSQSEPDPSTPGVRDAHTPGVSDSDDTTQLPDYPVTPLPSSHLPTKIARFFLILALLALLVDLFLSPTLSLPMQLTRLLFLAILLLLAYAEGGYRRG